MPSFIGFVPTSFEYIDCFFELAPLTSSDIVYDLGSGDGRLLFAALEKGAGRAVGVELESDLIHQATEEAARRGLEDRVAFMQSDVLDVELSNASVVLCYLCSSASEALKPKFESQLKPGAKVVLETFPIPGWKPVRTLTRVYRDFYLYVMPPENVPSGYLDVSSVCVGRNSVDEEAT